MTRLRREPGGLQTWQVVGRPFRVVGLSAGWLVVGTDGAARDLVARRGLTGHRFSSRSLAVRALGAALAEEAARPARGRHPGSPRPERRRGHV